MVKSLLVFEKKYKNEYYEEANKSDDLIHIHFFRKHVSTFISYPLILLLLATVSFLFIDYKTSESEQAVVINGYKKKENLVYGSWPVLENSDFYNKVKQDFINNRSTFIEANLSEMIIRYYENGEIKKEAPITHKGKEGSWWETPAGLYEVKTKEKNHFSSFGNVNMPYSIQFQGNFFIHGPSTYPDGTPTAASYSGGCIRVALNDMKEIYNLAKIGTPILVFEETYKNNDANKYKPNIDISEKVSYLAVDLENGFVFAENKSKDKRSIASITKLMTALISVEYINIEKETLINESVLVATSLPRLKSGQKIKVIDLLSVLLQESSNEAAMTLSNILGQDRFMELMNEKAKSIGMNNSNFVDSAGVMSGNISTPEDLFNLANYLYYNRSFILKMTTGMENRNIYGDSFFSDLNNFNQIDGVNYLLGGKTGISSSSGDSMLAIFKLEMKNNQRPVAIVVLGSEDAKRDIKKLLAYIENNYTLY